MSASTRVGTEVAGYRLEKVLGRGGMSVVYLAEHIRLGRKVALKLLAPALSEDESYRERFIRESRRAAELDHPNIIPIYDAGEGDGQLYISMRYVEGSDLKAIIKSSGPLQLGRTLFLLEQVSGALDAAHERELVHRDVKPSNILVAEPSDRAYLTDFGVVKHTASRGLTKTGFFIGTVDYAPPEQIEGLPLDPRTDVYALGCVFYESLTGRPPFDRDGEVAVMHAHLTEPPPKLTTARPDLPKALNQVVVTAMAKSKEERFGSCEEFIMAARDSALQRPTTTRRELQASDLVAVPPAEMPSPVALPDAARPAEPEPQLEAQAPAPGAEASAPAPGLDIPASAPSPAPAPTPPAAGEQEQRGRNQEQPGQRSQRARLVLTALLVAGAAAASGIGVYFATKQGDGTPGAAGGQRSEAGLPSLIPAQLFDNSCVVQSTPLYAGAVQSAVCTPPIDPAERKLSFYPDRWEISIFQDVTALQAAYDSLDSESGFGRDFGRCDGAGWQGEGPWRHTTGAKGPGGRRLCYFAGNVAVIAWSHEKLGQPSHADMLAVARASSHAELFDWWRFWHHQSLGKCAGDGCVAKLR